MNAAHFPAYAEELREFSASHGLPCGAPEDLRGLVATLDERGAFCEECASMLRSVMYRERGQADAGSLLMLVTGVWGGLTEPEAEAVAPLREFVLGAMRAPQIGELEPAGEDVAVAASCREGISEPRAGGAEQGAPVTWDAISGSEIERALRELEDRSPEVRMYRELLEQRDAALTAGRMACEAGTGEGLDGGAAAERPCAFASGFDPWDESSELQKELREFAIHRERMLAREAEKASRPLHAKLRGGAESALAQLLGRDNAHRRGLGLRLH